MSQLDIHPEHLIDRVLRGVASEAERTELASHVSVCRACAAEQQLGAALREPLRADSESPTSVVIDAALMELIEAGRLAPVLQNPSRGAPGKARAWLPWAAALCLFFTGSAAAATLIMAVRGSNWSAPPAASAAAPAAARAAHKHARAGSTPVPEPVVAAPPASVSPSPSIAPSPSVASQAHVRRVQGAAAPPTASIGAAELFAKARAAAMQGEFSASAMLYATLQKRFAASPQAHVSRVVLGRLYLEHLADAPAALAQFDAYLQKGGPNRPEALLGRARALRALGRVQEEVEALRSLVDAYPESLYVAPAEERLRAVE